MTNPPPIPSIEPMSPAASPMLPSAQKFISGKPIVGIVSFDEVWGQLRVGGGCLAAANFHVFLSTIHLATTLQDRVSKTEAS